MTAKQKAYRLALLKKIHIHKEYQRLHANGEWEEWLLEKFGVKSSKFLRIDQLLDVIALLEGVSEQFFTPSHALGPTPKQVKAVLSLKEDLGWNLARLEGFTQHTCKKSLSELSKEDTTALILGLTKLMRAQEAALNQCYTPLNNPHYNPTTCHD